MEYAIRLKLDDHDWIFVTVDDKQNNHCWDMRPQLFSTQQEAAAAAIIWGPKAEVVPYYKSQNTKIARVIRKND